MRATAVPGTPNPRRTLYRHATRSKGERVTVRGATLARVGVALAGGLGLVLAFPPYDVWLLAPLCIGALTLAVRGVSLWRAALLAYIFGLAFFVVLLRWTDIELGAPPWLILAAFQALYLAPLGAGIALVQRLPGWPVWTAALWVLEEALRGRYPFDGFTWGRLAFSQADAPTLGLASLGGAPLVTFAVALAGGLLAWVVVSQRGLPWRLGAAVGAGVVLFAAVPVPQPAADGRTVTVALVQGNVPRLGLDFDAQREAVLRNHVDATLDLAAQIEEGAVEQPDLVLWPENSSDIDPYRDADAAGLIDDAAQAVGVPILVGAVVRTEDDEHLENTGIVWDPATGPGDTYVKQHPVPFAEYIPLRDLARVVVPNVDELRSRDMVKGDEPGVLQIGPARVGDVICFEVAYDDVVRGTVREGAEVLAVQTNNATFGFSGESEQQLAMSRLRAVEHGRSVLVVATSGVSAVVDADGSVRERSEIYTRDVFVEPIQLSTAQTLATRVGAWPELLISALGLGAVVAAALAARRSRGPQSEPREAAADDAEPKEAAL